MLLGITHADQIARQFGNLDAAAVIWTPGTLPPWRCRYVCAQA